MSEIYDITIVGGGPVGLFTAFYAGMRQAKTKIIESLPQLGGQPALLYAQKDILDIAGFPAITGEELTQNLIQQLEHFQPTICLEEEVLSYDKQEGIFQLTTSKGTHYSRTIILTVGPGAFSPRQLKLEGADDFDNIAYTVKKLADYQDKEVMILGGGDSAVDWALALENYACQVHLVHRRDSFRAHEYSVKRLEESSVNILTPFLPDQLLGDDRLEKVTLKEVRGDEIKTIPVDDLIVNYGFTSQLGPLLDWGLELDRQKIKVDQHMETSIEGIYAAGDIVAYDGKLDLIATGFGEAPIAVSYAVKRIRPEEHLQPIQSTKINLQERGDK